MLRRSFFAALLDWEPTKAIVLREFLLQIFFMNNLHQGYWLFVAGVTAISVSHGKDVTACVVNTSDKFAACVNDTVGQDSASVVDTGFPI